MKPTMDKKEKNPLGVSAIDFPSHFALRITLPFNCVGISYSSVIAGKRPHWRRKRHRKLCVWVPLIMYHIMIVQFSNYVLHLLCEAMLDRRGFQFDCWHNRSAWSCKYYWLLITILLKPPSAWIPFYFIKSSPAETVEAATSSDIAQLDHVCSNNSQPSLASLRFIYVVIFLLCRRGFPRLNQF